MLKKWLLFFVIAAGIAVSLLAQNNNVFLTRTEFHDGQKWLVITGYNGSEKTVTIPSSIGGIPVRKIGDASFKLKGITDVILPQGIEVIGEQAFFGNQLSIVVIPTSVRVIADSAFDSNMLKKVTTADLSANKNGNGKVVPKVYYVAADKEHLSEELLIRAATLYGNFYDPLTGYDGKFKPVNVPKPDVIKDSRETSLKNNTSNATSAAPNSPAVNKSGTPNFSDQPVTVEVFMRDPGASRPIVQAPPPPPIQASTFIVQPPVPVQTSKPIVRSPPSPPVQADTSVSPQLSSSRPPAVPPLGNDVYSQIYIEVPGNYTGISAIPVINSKTVSKNETSFGNKPPDKNGNSSVIAKTVTNTNTSTSVGAVENGIGKSAYKNKGLDSFVIPEGTTFIGEGAFASNNLSSIVIPNSVRSIGSQAFMGNNLGDITIGENVKVQNDSFRYQFADYYRMNDCKAGTYILKAGHWNFNGQELPPKYVQ
ncbi:MAG: leucine-rich repeat domain-containing protein [Spirochaetaceae bacterium]|nr:leucine-rich repeat domain-containing protein [Spirochaetaceae bacterium]